jgi:hypothetical protein
MHVPRRTISQRLMNSAVVVKRKIGTQTLTGCGHIPVVVEINLLVFHGAPTPLHEAVSKARPRPSRLSRTRAAKSGAWNCALEGCTPWSVLKISGRWRANARSSEATQNSASG